MKNEFQIKTKVWVYPGMAAWRFATIPKEISEEISEVFAPFKRGWGSLKVRVSLGKTVWETSIFPDKKEGVYLLPLKAAVRKKEAIEDEDEVEFKLEILTGAS